MADRLGITETALQNRESGRSIPPLDAVDSMASAYECSFEAIERAILESARKARAKAA